MVTVPLRPFLLERKYMRWLSLMSVLCIALPSHARFSCASRAWQDTFEAGSRSRQRKARLEPFKRRLVYDRLQHRDGNERLIKSSVGTRLNAAANCNVRSD